MDAVANVIEVTDETFEQVVVEGSKQVPVVVDLWAEWCGPCRTLGPMLEQAAERRAGAFTLAKIDVDAHGVGNALLQAVRSQSIPTVIAFRDGQPVSMFIGAIPEQEIDRFLDSILPTEADAEAKEAAEELESGDVAEAEQGFREALAKEPDNRDAALGLARILIARGDIDEARPLVMPHLPDPEAEHLHAMIEVAEWASLPADGRLGRRPVGGRARGVGDRTGRHDRRAVGGPRRRAAGARDGVRGARRRRPARAHLSAEARRRPVLSRMSETHERIQRWWDADASVYDDAAGHAMSDPIEAAAWRRVLERTLPAAPAEVLDVGTGTGSLALLAAELGHTVTGVDLSEGMLARARDKASRAGHSVDVRPGSRGAAAARPVRRDRRAARAVDDPRAGRGAGRLARGHAPGRSAGPARGVVGWRGPVRRDRRSRHAARRAAPGCR